MNKKRKYVCAQHRNSFTLMELLVVIAIIAILSATLAPAIMKAWSKAYENRAKSEIAGLANIGTQIKLDTGYYVMLLDFDNTDSSKPTNSYNITGGVNDDVADTLISPVLTNDQWDGPYHTFQSGEISISSVANGTFSAAALPIGTPLDPWGTPYAMCWNDTEKVMGIYCAGPDGTFDSDWTTTSISATDDDIVYKFK